MRRAACAFTILLLVACSSAPKPSGVDERENAPQQPPEQPVWALVWSDDFAGDSGTFVDTTKWRPDTGDGCQMGICGWGNQEKQFYTASTDNIALDGEGHLQITARVAPAAMTCYYGPCRYTSGKISTRGKFQAQPGRVEARIKLPTGQGLWPAFWMLGAGWPTTPWPQCGELDIMEHKGSQPTITSSAIHGPGYSGATPFAHATTNREGSYFEDFHRFAVEWNANEIRFFVDSSLHYTVRRTDVVARGEWVFDRSFFPILNLAVGGHFDGDPQSDAILPATMLIDYVRVYRPE
ncbi:MAG: glycoside hydrolase family 16 protein [Gemmatimonadaceae bacterium]